MKLIFPAITYTNAVLAIYIVCRYMIPRKKRYKDDWIFTGVCVGSIIWSLGFAALFLQNRVEAAFWCRAVGMSGVFLYIIAAQIFACHMSLTGKIWKVVVVGFSLLGIPLYFLMTREGIVVFEPNMFGMSYHFNKGPVSNLYTIYTVVIALNILAIMLHIMFTAKVKRYVYFARTFLLLIVFMVVGLILDTIFPALGLPAIPGSTITQFWGMIGVYYSTLIMDRSRINIGNMSEYIYYSISEPVLVYDMDYRLQLINDAGISFLACEREEILRSSPWISQFFDVDAESIFRTHAAHQTIETVCKRNGCLCSLSVNAIVDDYGDVIGHIIVVGDLSEHMRAMERLEDARKQADMANRAKTAFLANMSHEIRTPMNAIVGFSELALTKKDKLDDQICEYLMDIRSASHNLLAIINDILDISKIESGKMELVNGEYYTRNLFNDVFLIVNGQAKKKGLQFVMSVDDDMPKKMYGDKIRIRGVLINLLNNAVKYTDRGTVELKAQIADRRDEEILIRFQVCDTGIGIRQEDQEKLFETFTQVDQNINYGKEGTGLGLAIVRGFVNLMGGKINVHSEYGKGSVFTVFLSQKVLDGSVMDKIYTNSSEVTEDYGMSELSLENVRVLVVDDNLMNLKMAKRSMEHYGLTVDIAGSGKLAVEMCRETDYRLVFMDQMMPVMDGVTAMHEIRKLGGCYAPGESGKIIILTANTMSGMRDQMMQEGFDEFLGKPINFKQLERLLHRFAE